MHAGSEREFQDMYKLTYTEQQMLHDIENNTYISPFVTNEHMIRSLDSVTNYEEFVPKVYPTYSSIGNTETVQTADSNQEADSVITQVETVEEVSFHLSYLSV